MSRRAPQAAQETFVYGLHPVLELLSHAPQSVTGLYVQEGGKPGRLQALQARAAAHNLPLQWCHKQALRAKVGEVVHQGVVAATAAFAYTPLERLADWDRTAALPPLLMALDQVQDPHNVGSLTRSALALGASGLLLCAHRACAVTPTVRKIAAGATAQLPICQVVNLSQALETLKKAGMWVVGTCADAPLPLTQCDLTRPTVLVMGSEGQGMRPLVRRHCDQVAHIPMHKALGSLNAAVAGGIALYEAARQRQAPVPARGMGQKPSAHLTRLQGGSIQPAS